MTESRLSSSTLYKFTSRLALAAKFESRELVMALTALKQGLQENRQVECVSPRRGS